METANSPTPLLSVTVLNYNYAHFLPTCLDSILSQTFRDFEIILINDKSTDNSVEVIGRYLSDPRVRFVDHETNKGFVASLIEGAELSRGKYITVISADDWVAEPTAFDKQIAVLQSDSDIAFAYSAYGHYESEHLPRGHVWRAAAADYVRPGVIALREILVNPYILHSGTLIRKTAYQATGGYDGSLKYAVDTTMWFALCYAGKAAYIDQVLYGYRRHATSMSKSLQAIRRSIEEVLSALDGALAKASPEERPMLAPFHGKAVKRALTAFAADEIFRNAYREGWRGFWVASQVRPLPTVLQRDTLVLILRTLLGPVGFRALEFAKSRLGPKSSSSSGADAS